MEDEKLRVSDVPDLILARHARARAERTGESHREVLKAVLKTELGRRLEGLRNGLYRDEEAQRWQDELAPKRAKKRRQARQEVEHSLAQRDAACEQFMQTALRKEALFARRRRHSESFAD